MKISWITRYVNSIWSTIKPYLELMVARGLIICIKRGRSGTFFLLTPMGDELLKHYRGIKRFLR